MSQVSPFPRTTCGHCQRDVAYQAGLAVNDEERTVELDSVLLMRHFDPRTGTWCVRRWQFADPRPLMDVLAEMVDGGVPQIRSFHD